MQGSVWENASDWGGRSSYKCPQGTERWNKHAAKWRNLGASHLAIATHNAEPTNVDGHLGRIQEYLNAVT